MDNFDLRKFLTENKLTTSSKQLEEGVVQNIVAAALMSLGIVGGVKGQEAPKTVQDTNQITWQQMTQPQRAAVKTALVSKGGFQLFQKYKDSISTDATNRLNADFARSANMKGMTVPEYQKYLRQNAGKKDQPVDGLNTCKSDGGKGSCTTGIKSQKRTIKDIQ